MKREASQLSVDDLLALFVDLEFPEYQREPTVWSRRQKQRLLDSMVRGFDIGTLYFYEREGDAAWECIDGRQRINAIASFFGVNVEDSDNEFELAVENEIRREAEETPYRRLDGLRLADLNAIASGAQRHELAPEEAEAVVRSLKAYGISIVRLSEAGSPDEFNLQFLRLNLGVLINGGEKLHAMVGDMRDLLFGDGAPIGKHPFFKQVSIPERRFAREQLAAQALLQAYTYRMSQQFTRTRYIDLQRFLKDQATMSREAAETAEEIKEVLDALREHVGDIKDLLRNRAVIVSIILFVWERRLYLEPEAMARFSQFVRRFLQRLSDQVRLLKEFRPDPRYPYLTEFQRQLTQASVERPAVTKRHEILSEQYEHWLEHDALMGEGED